jgi:hypothetical protein
MQTKCSTACVLGFSGIAHLPNQILRMAHVPNQKSQMALRCQNNTAHMAQVFDKIFHTVHVANKVNKYARMPKQNAKRLTCQNKVQIGSRAKTKYK